ncbi:MAG: hypothetical protein R6U00_06495, partial [Prochlorococcaceae cyanobacterium]
MNIAAGAGGGRRRQVLLPIPWQCDQVNEICDAVVYVYEEFQKGIDPDASVAQILRPQVAVAAKRNAEDVPRLVASTGIRSRPSADSTPLSVEEWSELIQAFREHKLLSGEIKDSTWHRVYRHHMKHVLGALALPSPPQNAKQLLEGLARLWADKPGGRTRQIQMQITSALLRWAITEGRLGEEWDPPQDLTIYVGRSRAPQAITTPLEVEHILALVEALPDPRWRLGFQLMAAYGLRPEELHHMQLRDGRLWCTYEKVASRGKTKPRTLRLLPCDDWAAEWKLAEHFAHDKLPPMRAGFAGNDLRQYLQRRSLWQQLRGDYEAKGEKLVPYSCRHGYAHRAHVICDLPPKVVAAAMGHSV